ncbi:von Willebrand factor, type A [Stanieria sp. NIES-3757]|nr:von Willebrand factor, type A [Stanieria sp. NIES-3757]
MKVNYSFSQTVVAVNQPTIVDLILNFQGVETNQSNSRRPLNLSLVLDRSGSMGGDPLRYAISAAQQLVEYLTPEDYLSVVVYDDTPQTILSPQPVENQAKIQAAIGKIKAGGLTNLSDGWLKGFDYVKSQQSKERINRVLLLTDGQANVGISDPQALIEIAKEKAKEEIITTTLGFGNHFNEDLLIGIADAAGGNFYFIQSPKEAVDVFRIEMESLVSVVAQNLTVTLQPETGISIAEILNNYRFLRNGEDVEVLLGDVYHIESKPLAVQFSLSAIPKTGKTNLATLSYTYQTVVDGKIDRFSEYLPISINVVSAAEASNIEPDPTVTQQASQLRIAKKKDEAVTLADKGDYQQAAEILRQTVAELKLKALQEYFEIAEEIEQLDYYAQSLEQKRFDLAIRKEMRDQSYQARKRDRDDLKLRGTTTGAANNLPTVTDPGEGILLKCDRIDGKLRIRVISEGYNHDFNVQFPRSIRQEGVTYVVDKIELSANGTFYRATGTIRRLLKPGETITSVGTSKPRNLQKAKTKGTAADLETTDTVGDGVLVQCIKEKSKLRARVVSDGYNPDWNMRFPREIREEGMLYVVDEVQESSQGGYYVAYGKIKRLVQ